MKDKQITGAIERILLDTSREMNIHLDQDKFEFLSLIAKTKYSGLTLTSLAASMKILQNKDDKWFRELVEDGLAETFNFKSPHGKYDLKWDGWFVTKKGRQILREVSNRL